MIPSKKHDERSKNSKRMWGKRIMMVMRIMSAHLNQMIITTFYNISLSLSLSLVYIYYCLFVFLNYCNMIWWNQHKNKKDCLRVGHYLSFSLCLQKMIGRYVETWGKGRVTSVTSILRSSNFLQHQSRGAERRRCRLWQEWRQQTDSSLFWLFFRLFPTIHPFLSSAWSQLMKL